MQSQPSEPQLHQETLVEAYRATFETPAGQIVLNHLAKNCHLFDSTALNGDPYLTHLREGERRVVLAIIKVLNYDLGKLYRMLEQRNEWSS
mgnify:CR=1 FL=1